MTLRTMYILLAWNRCGSAFGVHWVTEVDISVTVRGVVTKMVSKQYSPSAPLTSLTVYQSLVKLHSASSVRVWPA